MPVGASGASGINWFTARVDVTALAKDRARKGGGTRSREKRKTRRGELYCEPHVLYIYAYRYTYSLLKFGYLSRRAARPLSIFYIREDFELCDCRKSKLLPRRSSSSPCESASFFSWKCARASFFGLRESARKPMGSLLLDEVIKYAERSVLTVIVTRKSCAQFSILLYETI